MHPYFMKQKRLLFDGAFGTYYASLYGNEEPCEMANVKAPTRVAAAVVSLLIFKRLKKDYKKKLCYHFPHRQQMIRFFIRIAILCAKNYKEKKKSYV